jgi:hypothetical protein
MAAKAKKTKKKVARSADGTGWGGPRVAYKAAKKKAAKKK